MSPFSPSGRTIAVLTIALGLLLVGCSDTSVLAPSTPTSNAGQPATPGQTPPGQTPAPAPAPAPSSSEPVWSGSAGTSLWADDFEASASTSDLYARYSTMNGENGLNLDATGGVNGSRGLRVDWRARNGCSDDSHLMERAFPTPAQEVIVQYSVRYTPGFVFDWIGRSGGCSGNAKKLFFLWAAEGSRFDFISENNFLGVGSDVDHPLFAQNQGTAIRPQDLADGNWHRITLRVRQSSTPTATDGYILGWIDGVQRWSITNIASNASGGWTLFKMPTTFNQGSPVDQAEWMDGLRIWTP